MIYFVFILLLWLVLLYFLGTNMTRADNKIAYLTSQGKCPAFCLKLLYNIIIFFRFNLICFILLYSVLLHFVLICFILFCRIFFPFLLFCFVLFYFICSCLHYVNSICTCVYSNCLNTSQKDINNLFII